MSAMPFPQSYWVQPGLLCAGHYPGDVTEAARDAKLQGLLDCNLRRIVNLMEPTEKGRGGISFAPYLPRLRELAAERGTAIEWVNLSIRDGRAPTAERMTEILAALDDGLARGVPTYVHCWGGHGRTGTTVACWLIRSGRSSQEAFAEVARLRADLPKNHDPFEGDQRELIAAWLASPTSS